MKAGNNTTAHNCASHMLNTLAVGLRIYYTWKSEKNQGYLG